MRLDSRSSTASYTADMAEADRRLQQLDVLQRLTEAVNRAERPETIYDEAIDGMIRALDASRAAVLLFDRGNVMRYVAWRGLSAEYREIMEGRSPWHRDTPAPRTIVIADTHDSEYTRAHVDALDREGIRALMIVPLIDAGELLGRVVVHYERPHAPDAQDVRLAESIAGHVALAITRRRSWDELAGREAAFTALAEQAPDIIARFDREFRHVYVNPAVEQLTGVARERYLGRTNAELGMPEPALQLWEEVLARVFETGSADTLGFEYITPTGKRYYEASLVPERDSSGEVISVLATTRDLTDRKQAEDRLRFLTDAGTLLASSLDLRTTLDAIVRIAAASLGDGCAIDILRDDGSVERIAMHSRSSEVAALLEEMDRRYPADIRSTAGNVVALRTGQPQLYPEITEELMRAASRDEGHLELWRRLALHSAMCVPLIARERRMGVVTVFTTDQSRSFTAADLDVSIELARRAAVAMDHAMLFDEMRRARDEAQEANAAKAKFLAVVSHELRTPLAAILGYTELVVDEIVGPLNHTQRDQLERIKASGTHLLMLIEEILSFARIEAGHESLRVEEVDLSEVIREVAAVVQSLVQKKRLACSVHLPDEPIAIVTDSGKVRQILLNLLGNAIKFTESGGLAISVVVESSRVLLSVEDTGVGIPEQHREHVFDAFWQVEHVTTRRKGGTGLGLSVARQLARLLGGDIFVESELGRGSRFVLELPRVATPR